MKVLVTGANGHVGGRLIREVRDRYEVIGVVRSERAAQALKAEFGSTITIKVISYSAVEALAAALDGVDYAVHLVGIIKESRANSFEAAHEAACRAVCAAAGKAAIRGIIHLGVLGSAITSGNACFASRGRAEQLLCSGSVPTRIIAVPMVLGEGDYASRALFRQATRRVAVTFRSSSLEQPIYAGDVVEVIKRSLETGFAADRLEIAGPESLTRADLIRRASAIVGVRPPIVVSLPIVLGRLIARGLELFANPPLTRAMLGVLDHDDNLDSGPVCQALGLTLTSLDEMLTRVRPV